MSKVILNQNVDFENAHEVEVGGVKFEIKDKIATYRKKQFANDYVNMAIIYDYEKGIAYEDPYCDVIMAYLICKYYTNIDVDQYTDRMDDLYDIVGCCIDEYLDAKEWIILDMFVRKKREYEINRYNEENSLFHRLKMAMSGVVDGSDLTELISKNKDLNADMISLLEQVNGKNDNVIFPWAAKK